jgi:hypothetical protein
VQPTAEAREETSLGDVSQRISARVGPYVEAQSDGCGRPAPLLDRHAAKLAPLDPTELTARHADGSAGRVLADTCACSCEADLTADLVIQVPELREFSVQSTISSRHAAHGELARSSTNYPPIRVASMRAERGTLARRANHRQTVRIRGSTSADLRGRMTLDPYTGSGDDSGDG